MKKLLAFVDKIKYFALIYAALLFNFFVAVGGFKVPHIYAVSYSMYLLDYSFGFCARFLPGQIYKWITGGNYNPDAVQNYCVAVLLIAFVFISILMSWFIRSAPKESKKLYIVLALFYVSGPATFALYSYGLGIIDTLWIIFTPIAIMLLGNKYSKYALPLMVIPMVLVHFSAITCYLVLLFFILLYQASSQKEKKGKIAYSVLFSLCFIIGVGLTAYFIMIESVNVKYSADEFLVKAQERSQIGEYTDLLYVNFDIFKRITFQGLSIFDGVDFPYDTLKDDVLIPAGSSLPSGLVKIINAAWPNIDFHLHYYFGKGRVPDELMSLLKMTVFTSPIIAFMIMYFKHRIKLAKEEKNRFQRLLFALAIIYIPIALLFWFMCSIDHFRYFNHIMIVEGAFMLYVMYCNPEDTSVWVKEQFSRIDKRFFALYAIIYFVSGRISL